MKKIAIFLSVILSMYIVKAQNPSTLGKDFWVTYMPNAWPSSDGDPNLTLIITSMRNCTGTVSNPNTGWSTSFSVTAGIVTNVTVPLTEAYTRISETITNTGIHVESTDTISCYASNFIDFTFDITNVLPTPTLMEEYLIQTYPSSYECEFAIVATEDNTIVDITLSANSAGGHYADSTFNVTLQRGECYQVLTNAEFSDFSGTHICARNCKKIAVFQGNLCANIPGGACCCDHIVEQSIPTAYWGKKFVVTTSSYRYNDIIRVTALRNNCQVKKDGVLLTTLNAGQTHEFTMQNSEDAVYIETTEPACVYLYFTGYDYGGTDGDPASVIINPIEQQINEITFGTFATNYANYHVVNIVTETAHVNTMILDGTNISSAFTTVAGNPMYSYAKQTISPGSHTLHNTAGGFLAHIYGLGLTESYAYSVGESTIDLNRQLYVNDINASILSNGTFACPNEPITFDAQIEYQYTRILWYFNDGQFDTGRVVVHQFATPDDYDVTVLIERETHNCFNNFYDTIYTPIHILPIPTHTTSATICPGMLYIFNDSTYTEAGIYIDTIPSTGLCDSIDVLDLSLEDPPMVTHPSSIYCLSDSFAIVYGDGFPAGGFYTDTNGLPVNDSIMYFNGQAGVYPFLYSYIDENGCSDTANFTISVYPEFEQSFFDTICQQNAYNQHDFNLSADDNSISGDFTYTHELTTIYGCDSIITLHLSVSDLPDIEFVPAPERSMLSANEAVQFNNLSDINNHNPYDNYMWLWDFGDGNTEQTTDMSAQHTYGQWGRYLVSLTFTSNYGCDNTISHYVYIDADLEFPNVITPNGDGVNDMFAIKNLNPELPNILTIYNRWGKKVYEMENYQTYAKDEVIYNKENGFAGENLSDGVYFYTFHYVGYAHAVDYHSTLTIIR